MALADLRRAYEAQVVALRPIAEGMIAADFPDEVVARTMFAARQALKLFHKYRLARSVATQIDVRNKGRYGSHDGPSFGDLRARYGSWTGVIDAACRPGGGDLRYLL